MLLEYDSFLINLTGGLIFYTSVWAFVTINQYNVIHFRTDMVDIAAHYGDKFFVAVDGDKVVGTGKRVNGLLLLILLELYSIKRL